MTRVINLRTDMANFPGQFDALRKQWPFAVSRALNDTAFAMQPRLTRRAASDLRFSVPSRQALGIRVTGKASKTNLEATVGTSRSWLVSQVEAGKHNATSGITYRGRRYLLIPIDAKMGRGGRRKLKGSKRRGQRFIIESAGRILMLERFASGRDGVRLIGSLHLEAQYGNEFGWQDTITAEAAKAFEVAFDKWFARAIATAK